MMANACSIKGLNDKRGKNDEASYGRSTTPKLGRERMEVVRGLFLIIFSELTGRVV